MIKLKLTILCSLFLCLNFVHANAKAQAEKVLSGYDVIWGFDFISNDQIILAERNGTMSLVDLKTKKKTPVQGVPAVHHSGQGGLLDVKLHPNFSKNKWIYFTHSFEQNSKNTTRLARAQLEGATLKNLQVLFTADAWSSDNAHYGSRITFDNKGHIFFGIGERNEREKAQDLNLHNGKIIRLKEDGQVPEDNPFYGQKNKKPEVWSYGHRNPQGTFYDLETNKLWVSEHGPRGGDELNLVEKGKNYGWPVITYGREYWGPGIGTEKKDGMEQPIKMYKPSIAPSTLFIYKNDKYKNWKNNFFIGALALQHLNRVTIENDKPTSEERLFQDTNGRIRHVEDDINGTIYFSTDSGEFYKITRQ